MAYRVVETESAGEDIDAILGYIIKEFDNLSAASDFADEIDDKYEKLEANPYMYEESRDARLRKQGYRRIPIKNYVMLYLVDEARKEVNIARVFYGKQDYANLI